LSKAGVEDYFPFTNDTICKFIKRKGCMKKLIGVAVVWLWAFAALSAVTVTNVVAAQRPGTKLIDITYDIASTETNAVKVFLLVSQGADAVNVTNLTGDVGSDVATGTGKSMVWDMGADWNGRVSTGVVFTITVGVPAGGDPSAVSWEVVNARWTKNTYTNGAVTMSDRDTGNMWLYSVNTYSGQTWYEATSYCDSLVYAGYSDWRLPDKNTLSAQYSQQSYFSGVHTFAFWSSTPLSAYSDIAWLVEMSSGSVHTSYKSNSNIVWPMRDGQLVAGGTATADLDSRDYTLTVASAHGTPVPNIGTNLYAWRAAVTASVDQAVVDQGIKWQCSGWSGAGSVPVSGTTNKTAAITLTNPVSSITWNWQTLFSITNVTAVQRSGTKLVDITYDLSSTVTNMAKVFLSVSLGSTVVNVTNLTGDAGAGVTPGTGKSIIWNMGAEWNGNVASGAVFTVSAAPAGGDLMAADWAVVNSRWVKNTYANGDITLGDPDTGRMWLYDANPCGRQNWYGATNYCDSLTYAGHSDWRLPNLNALQIQNGQRDFFSNVQEGIMVWYWSSTAYDANRMWCVIMGVDSLGIDDKSRSYYVWPMRDGLGGTTGTVLGGTATANLDSRDYTLTVTGGSGGGSYTYQQQVTVTADAPPAGQLFDRWTGDTQFVASVTSATTKVTLTAQAVILAALYKDEFTAQVIRFGSLPGKRVDDVPFALSTTASSGLPVSYTSSNPDVAAVSGNTVTITGFGITLITASQAGDAAYFPADNVSQPLRIAGMPGDVVAWGKTWNGSTLVDVTVPPGLSDVKAVAAGTYPVVVVKADGTVTAWGYNGYGQINVPPGLSNVATVAVGTYHIAALKTNGTVVAWGNNGTGQTTVPAGLSNVTAIAAGGDHTVALKSDGTVVAWGSPSFGQATVPAGLSNVTAIAAGGEFTMALKSDGTVTAWGHNDFGQTTVPAGLSNVMAIAAGQYHALALKSDGTVTAWGSNSKGQATVPAGLSNVTALAAGFGHTVALKSDRTVTVWGQWHIGGFTYVDATVPAGLSNVIAIATGGSKIVAIVSVPPGIGSPDSDADGIPDLWEQQYFGGSTNADPNAFCSNGVNTLIQAYIAGLNPHDPQSRLLISDFRSLTADSALLWNAVSGRVYSVYWTTNLMSSFQCLESNIPWTQGCFTNSAAVPCGYYKIGVRLEN
jgi:hypothetical protein